MLRLLLLLACSSAVILLQHGWTAKAEDLIPMESANGIIKYTLDVQPGQLAPDCFSRPVILVNGHFQPTIRVTQGDLLEVGVRHLGI
jgi:hypothetical protein